ncbi:MAG: adenylate/guanylate cyclase domain-containing protein [Xanthobacteraceae bacterium]
MTAREDAAERKRVLVVDDSFIMRNVMTEIVESDPELEVVGTAEDGKIALQRVRQLKPDVVLLDIRMPEMSGLETLRRLGLRSACKVVVLSSLVVDADSAERVEALRLGAVAAIAKPSGGVSLDLKQKRASQVVRVVREALGLPPLLEAISAAEPAETSEVSDLRSSPFADLLMAELETGVLVFDREGRLMRANAAAARILRGCDLTVGRATIASVCHDFNQPLEREIWDVIAGCEPLPAADISFAVPDGEWIAVRRSVRPIRMSAMLRGALVLLDDIAEAQRVRSLLDRTVSSEVTKTLIEAPAAALTGEIREATILFADIRGFTRLADSLGPHRTVDLLNRYFSYMADVIAAEGGVIDKFIGDAIMALFGLPRSHGDDADRAVAAARNMQRALRLLNEHLAGSGHRLEIGIGIASGHLVAGQIGAPDRMNYTVIGSPVNLAARIEGVTKSYGSAILICGGTFARLARRSAVRKVDVVVLKGHHAPTTIFEVFVDEPGAGATEWLQAFDAGVAAYVAGDFVAAQTHLARAQAANPADAMTAVLARRCRRLGLEGRAWTGAWELADR